VQTTLNSSATFTGVGLHSGIPVTMTVHPAGMNHGIWFKRADVTDADPMIPALFDAVEMKPLCTRIVNAAGVEVTTIEHIMAALAGCGVRNALIEIDGPEVPIMDGAAGDFVRGLEISFEIDFVDAAIGAQSKTLNMANGTFVRELADSRTFCRKSDIDAMHANGLALGGTYENAVVVDGDHVLSPGGLRHDDEAVRHKMLDALGDLSLAGAPILGRYTGIRAGHAMTNMLLRKLFATPDAYRVVECSLEQVSQLPGVGVRRADLALVA